MSLRISLPQEYEQIEDFFKANHLYIPEIPKDGHCLAYAMASALTLADLRYGGKNGEIDQTLQGLAALIKFTPLWTYQQSRSETYHSSNSEFLMGQIRDPDKYGVSDIDPHKRLEQLWTTYAIWPLQKPLPPDLWRGFDHLRLMASYFQRDIFLMAKQQNQWVYQRFSSPDEEEKPATMHNATWEEWKEQIEENEAPILLVLERDHFQPVIPIERQRVKVQRLRSLRNAAEEGMSIPPILKLQDIREAYRRHNVSQILTSFQEAHLTMDARKELLRALEPENDRGEEGIIFYNEYIPANLQTKLLQGEQMESIASEYAEIQNITLQGAQAIITDYQLSLTQEEEVSQQNTQDSTYQPEEEWITFSSEMKNEWKEHRKTDPHIPNLENKKDLKHFIGKFPQSFLYAQRSLKTPYNFLQTLPPEMTAHWQDAIYAQSIYIQLLAIQRKNQVPEIEIWLSKLGNPNDKRFSVYSRLFYNKMTLKSQWTKAKKHNYWDSEELAALDIDHQPQSSTMALASELYGTRLTTGGLRKTQPADYICSLIDLFESKQDEQIEEGLRNILSQYIALLIERRTPRSPGY
jgi:hypothetical protein